MVNTDDPSPIKRLGEQTRNFVRFRSIFNIGFLSAILLVGSLVVQDVIAEETVVPSDTSREDLHTYTSCLFREGVHNDVMHVGVTLHESCVEEIQTSKAQQSYSIHFTEVLKGHPMEVMADALALEDPTVASFMVGIAKQESNWGKRSPWKAGEDCYNYWGYKTSGSRGQALGHACFGSPEEAVQTVAKRIHYFVYDTGRTTASRLLVWKCGNSCAGHSPEGVARWVGTVDTYSQKVLNRIAQATQQEEQPLLLTRK